MPPPPKSALGCACLNGHSQVRSQEFTLGGAVSGAGNSMKRCWSRFWSVFTQMQSVFLPKIRWSPKKKVFAETQSVFLPKIGWSQKKAFSQDLQKNPVFWSKSHQIHIANPSGGAIFIFPAKIGLKSTKNVVFCILFRSMRGIEPSSWLRYWSQHISHCLKPFNKCFQKVWFVNNVFLHKVLYTKKYIRIFRLLLKCLLAARKENLTCVSTGSTGRSKNLDPTGFHLCSALKVKNKQKRTNFKSKKKRT